VRLLALIPLVALSSCFASVSQTPSVEAKEDAEFSALLTKSQDALTLTAKLINIADKRTNEVVTQTSTKIVDLKEEVQVLKIDLNEANNTPLIIDLGTSIELLPIDTTKEDR
jgi:hypothetical protein